jgi:sarcosine oxidase, subunit beta
MPYRLLRFGLSRKHPEPRMFTRHDALKTGYEVVIIGAGGHGLAAAYYLARDHGIRNVAVLEKGYLGGGNTGRNTTIIRPTGHLHDSRLPYLTTRYFRSTTCAFTPRRRSSR